MERATRHRLRGNSWVAQANFAQANQAYQQAAQSLALLASAHQDAAFWHVWLELHLDQFEVLLPFEAKAYLSFRGS
ncbi:MAG: hypothetical protein AB4911_03165 [Oscillochloridaceae bacterium umkhey_bin13]